MRAALFISNHGWGHLSRSLVIARALLRRGHSVLPVVAPEMRRRVLDALPGDEAGEHGEGVEVVTGALDRGYAFAAGGSGADAEATRHLLSLAHEVDRDVLAAVRSWRPDVVLADATPWASEVAAACGVPAVLCSNFGWDAQYDALFAEDHSTEVARILAEVRRQTAAFTLGLELPFGPGLPGVAHRRPVPLVGQRPRGEPLPVPLDRPLVTWAFGRTPAAEQPTAALEALAALCVERGLRLVTGEATARALDASGVPMSVVPEDVSWPDLVAASRLVVTKAGYNTVTEALRGAGYVIAFGITGLPEERAMLDAIEAGGHGGAVRLDEPDRARRLVTLAEEMLARGPREPLRDSGEKEVVEALEGIVSRQGGGAG